MEMLRFANNFDTTLTGEIWSNSTSMQVASIAGFDSTPTFGTEQWFEKKVLLLTLTHPTESGYEVVAVTGHTGLALDIQRGIEGSPGHWPAGTKVQGRVTAKMLARFPQLTANSDNDPVLRTGGTSIVLEPSELDFVSQATAAGGAYSLVFAGRSNLVCAIQLSGYPVLQLAHANYGDMFDQSGQDLNLSNPSFGGSIPVDLGEPAVWEPNLKYPLGSVVVPSVPDGNQYWLEKSKLGVVFYSGATEPDFSNGGADGSGFIEKWRGQAMPLDIKNGLYHSALITEVGFICHESTASSAPVVSIGTDAQPGLYVSNQELSGGANKRHVYRFPVNAGGGALQNNIRYRLETSAEGGRFVGRFYWRALFIESWEDE